MNRHPIIVTSSVKITCSLHNIETNYFILNKFYKLHEVVAIKLFKYYLGTNNSLAKPLKMTTEGGESTDKAGSSQKGKEKAKWVSKFCTNTSKN